MATAAQIPRPTPRTPSRSSGPLRDTQPHPLATGLKHGLRADHVILPGREPGGVRRRVGRLVRRPGSRSPTPAPSWSSSARRPLNRKLHAAPVRCEKARLYEVADDDCPRVRDEPNAAGSSTARSTSCPATPGRPWPDSAPTPRGLDCLIGLLGRPGRRPSSPGWTSARRPPRPPAQRCSATRPASASRGPGGRPRRPRSHPARPRPRPPIAPRARPRPGRGRAAMRALARASIGRRSCAREQTKYWGAGGRTAST